MKKAIVTTTIYSISEALKRYCEFKDWDLFIVGDLKTPHEEYLEFDKNNDNVYYLSPDYQEKNYKEISDLIGWNIICRRLIGYLDVLKKNYDIIASIDDDNQPLDNWGKDLKIGIPTVVYFYELDDICFDSIGATNYKNLWHRGFPIQNVNNRNNKYKITTKKIIPDIQACFWNGDPDIDAICRLEHKPMCFFDSKYFPISCDTFSPFNSQNTFFSREALKKYVLLPFIGRMDDIWASYYLQTYNFNVIYTEASVFQDRNIQNLTKNMKDEFIGYENTYNLLEDLKKNRELISKYLPEESYTILKKYLEITDSL